MKLWEVLQLQAELSQCAGINLHFCTAFKEQLALEDTRIYSARHHLKFGKAKDNEAPLVQNPLRCSLIA